MAKPRFRYLVFLNSNGFLLWDAEMDHLDVPPFIKDTVLEVWKGQGWRRNDLSVIGPLSDFSDDESVRNAQRSARKITRKVGNNFKEIAYSEWSSFLEPLFPQKFKVP